MISTGKNFLVLVGATAFLLASASLITCTSARAEAQESQAAPATGAVVKVVGTIKAIAAASVTLTTDSGLATILIESSTRMLRTAPGQKDLKGATPIQFQDLQVGDRMLVRGRPSGDEKSVVASSVIVMKEADIAARQEREREDWQKRGLGGLVTAIDAVNGAITVSTSTMAGGKATTVHISKDTVIRRYAPDSVKFDDATPGTLDQIKPGDQVRARGTRNAEGTDFAAEEIVSGAFRNIAGTVVSVDAANNSINVLDLAAKKPVILKISSDSQLRSLPAPVAERIAARLKGGPPGGPTAASNAPAGEKPNEISPGSPNGGSRHGGPADFQQMLNRMPAVSLADLQKGTPVMIVATEGSASNPPTAITLLTGVEPILTASPDSGHAAMLLSPWNLGGADAGAGGNP